MNINSLMPRLFLKTLGNKTGFPDSLNKMSPQYQNRYADVNEVKLNTQGISGMSMHGKNPSEYRQIIDISDEGKQKLFDMVKSEFIQNNGVLEGDTTKRTEVFSDYQRSIPEEDRLKATWTLQQLEFQYRSEFVSAVKRSNPNWDLGKPFDHDVIQKITIEDVSGTLDKQIGKGFDIHI